VNIKSWADILELLSSEPISYLLYALGISSVFFFFFSIFFSLWLIEKLPSDYFLIWHKKNYRHRHWLIRFLFYVCRNFLAVILLVAGIAMLFLPGQGLLTILLAFVVSDVAFKRRLLDQLIARDKIQRSLNWIRLKKKRQPFRFPRSDAS